MKVYTEVEVDLRDVKEIEPLAYSVKDFLDDYDQMKDVHTDAEWLDRAVELIRNVSVCFAD